LEGTIACHKGNNNVDSTRYVKDFNLVTRTWFGLNETAAR
jgi:hypothetical protein